MVSKPMWMVRAGEGSKHIRDFTDRSIVAIRCGATGPLVMGISREELTRRVIQGWPKYSFFKPTNAVGQIFRFINVIAVGDWVISYDSSRRVYLIGKVVGDPAYESGDIHQLRHYRKVAWEYEVPRGSLSVSSKKTLGAIQTLFLLSDSARDEILNLTKGNMPVETGCCNLSL